MLPVLRSLRINTFVSNALNAAGAAGICFRLFGNSSSFRAAPGQGSRDNVIYFKLSSATNSCGPAFPSPSGSSPLPTPQGTFELGRYRLFAAVNKEYDLASQTAWRLYICILVGLALGLICRQLTETFMNRRKRDAQRLAAAATHGVGFLAMHGLGIGGGSTFLPMAIVAAAILGTYNLYGSYGTALASVALLTTLGVTAAAGVARSISDTVGGIAGMARLPPATRALISSLRASANTAKAICRVYSTISAVFTAYALLFVLVQDSGQTASPRGLLGGPRVISTRFLGDEHASPLTSGFVVAAVLVGFMLPLRFSGLQLISVSPVAQKMIEVWGQLRQYPGLLSSASVAQPDHAKCLDIAGQSSIVELLLPGLSCILAPFIIGFGFGQQALSAMLLAAIGSGYALSLQ
jgi:K(+)-stimulated pyrophosphate-energized sodium pump